ncbi:putative sugar nucleotidyl transferase [Ferruginibacter albus]|uniref:putative sugar nucleotidyl transferase n=1 Tax=Ferruginibacter albus TaxID=2875540 RepID=UPI001CC79A8D|nr:putative sugar nucleotidyl transferase [Ferruginibacter albus]UAY51161.1 glucose-1-phosphate thymidylyltransferase [Ferruginibacter albus]
MSLSFSISKEISDNFYPFTQTRKAEDIRIGILTIKEKWQLLNANEEITSLRLPGITSNETKTIEKLTDIIHLNDWAICQDFALLTKNRTSQPVSSTNKIIAPENVFLEEAVKMEHCIINASNGPVYIGKNAEVMEGSVLRGPVSIGENAIVKMGTKIYASTTIGPHSMAGGEIKNSIIFGYSNKAHDGYLGDSVLGEWCNLGAGTSNSNIKNTAGDVKLWNHAIQAYESVGLKCGLIMGDYSRAAINTSFNTGTVVGVCCNIFNEGFPPKFIPDFTWGNERYELPKAMNDIDNWKKLKGKRITEEEKVLLEKIYKQPK